MSKSPEAVGIGATFAFAHRLALTLIDKGVLTKEEAAKVMVDTANEIRTGTEDDPMRSVGEATARGFEKVAAWLLGTELRI